MALGARVHVSRVIKAEGRSEVREGFHQRPLLHQVDGRGGRGDEQGLGDFPNPLQLPLEKRQLPLQGIDPRVFRLQNGGQRRLRGRGGRRLARAGRRRDQRRVLQLALKGAHRIGRRLKVLRRDTPPVYSPSSLFFHTRRFRGGTRVLCFLRDFCF